MEKYGIMRDAMDNSKASIIVKFDRNKNFLGAEPDMVSDISGVNHQDGNNKFSPDTTNSVQTINIVLPRN